MIKKYFLIALALLAAGQLLVAQELQLIALNADGVKTAYALLSVQKIISENNTMTVKLKTGNDVTNIICISFANSLSENDYSKLKINEVSGVGEDPDKFYELINTGTEDINLGGCKIYYNANSGTNGAFPPNGNQGLTWTGCVGQIIGPGELLTLIGRYNPCSFTTGLTAARILVISLKAPDDELIDECIRAFDTGDYTITNKSFSRIPDGTGPFYFTTKTPGEFNGTNATGLLKVPQTQQTMGIEKPKTESSIFIYPNPAKENVTINGVKKGITIKVYDSTGRFIQTVTAQEGFTDINVSSLQQGVYVLQIDGEQINFIKQ